MVSIYFGALILEYIRQKLVIVTRLDKLFYKLLKIDEQ